MLLPLDLIVDGNFSLLSSVLLVAGGIELPANKIVVSIESAVQNLISRAVSHSREPVSEQVSVKSGLRRADQKNLRDG